MSYEEYFRKARAAVGSARAAGAVSGVDATLIAVADALVRESEAVLAANELDLARMDTEDSRYDRLKLTYDRIAGIAEDMRKVASLPNVLDKILEEKSLPNGLRLSRVSVPLGVVGIIYEARPNVTADAWSLCYKTGNVVLLKGGSDAAHSNAAIVRIIQRIAGSDQVQLLPGERAATEALLQARGYVDVVIPRGSQGLIDYVRDHARVPVIETGAGVVHTYLDSTADAAMAARVIENAKTRRVSVCNALDCLLVHRDRLGELPELLAPLAAKGVEIRADAESYAALTGRYALLERADGFGTEFLSLKLAVKTVGGLTEALAHIREYGSGHSEAILTGDAEQAEKFVRAVDAAAVYVNTSTAFTDGAQFGLGAEIGISTQKLHTRGPMGLEALTSYKWIIRGDGQVRP